MALGGSSAPARCWAVLNTLYTVVGYRRRETATLRALGFADLWVLGGALGEAIILCVGSAAIGAAFAWALYHDHAWSSLLAGNSRMVFRMHIGAQELALAFAVAVTISLIGGLLGALRTLRAPAAQGLR
ncbi:MAG: ABC transporter permease [Gammaproteobacteria bacterium]